MSCCLQATFVKILLKHVKSFPVPLMIVMEKEHLRIWRFNTVFPTLVTLAGNTCMQQIKLLIVNQESVQTQTVAMEAHDTMKSRHCHAY